MNLRTGYGLKYLSLRSHRRIQDFQTGEGGMAGMGRHADRRDVISYRGGLDNRIMGGMWEATFQRTTYLSGVTVRPRVERMGGGQESPPPLSICPLPTSNGTTLEFIKLFPQIRWRKTAYFAPEGFHKYDLSEFFFLTFFAKNCDGLVNDPQFPCNL